MLLKLLPLLVTVFTTPALGDDSRTETTSLPISQLFSITIRDISIPSQWKSSNRTNFVEFRPLIPFKVGDQLNIMRITVPYRTRGVGGPGIGDTRAFDLLTFQTEHGIWGTGPIVNLRANSAPGGDTIQGGIVLGVIQFTRHFAYGVLNQNLFSEQIAASTLQPVFIFPFNERWTIGLGDLPFVFNWKSLSRTFVPIGFQLGYQLGRSKSSPRIFVNPQYNTRNIQVAPQWTFTAGFTLPLAPVSSGG